MRPELHNLLLTLDSPHDEEWERPPGFDVLNELRKVKKVAEKLGQTLGLKFALDDQVQDASHFASLYGAVFESATVGLRFSAFGNMVLAFTGNVRAFSSEGLPADLTPWLEAQGYVVIRPEDIDAPYDGVNQHLPGWDGTTWFGRYFDYL